MVNDIFSMKKFCNSKFLIHVVCSFGLLACSPEKSKDTPSGDQQIAHGGGITLKLKIQLKMQFLMDTKRRSMSCKVKLHNKKKRL